MDKCWCNCYVTICFYPNKILDKKDAELKKPKTVYYSGELTYEAYYMNYELTLLCCPKRICDIRPSMSLATLAHTDMYVSMW